MWLFLEVGFDYILSPNKQNFSFKDNSSGFPVLSLNISSGLTKQADLRFSRTLEFE